MTPPYPQDQVESDPALAERPGRGSFLFSGGIAAAALVCLLELMVNKAVGLHAALSELVGIPLLTTPFAFGVGIALAGRLLEHHPERAERCAPYLYLAGAIGTSFLVCGMLVLLLMVAVSGYVF